MNREKSILLCKRLGVIVIYVLMFFFVNRLFKDFDLGDENLTMIVYEYIIYGILFISSVLLLKKEITTGYYNFKSKTVGNATLEIVFGLAACYMCSMIGSLVVQSLGAGSTTSINEMQIDSLFESKYGGLLILVVCVIGPIVEELVYRGALLRGLRELKVPGFLCIIISGFLFGLVHVADNGDFIQIFPYLFMGFALGFIYYKSNSIFTSTIVHILLNSISTSISLILIILEKMGVNMEQIFTLLK